jgi:hypothetical protein
VDSRSISCCQPGRADPEVVTDTATVGRLLFELEIAYRASTQAGEQAAQFWAGLAVHSHHPLAPLAHVPGVFAALWTPQAAPTTAFTLGTAGYGFVALPRSLVHFTTLAGARGIAAEGAIRSSTWGLFGPGVYLAALGRPLNLFVRATATRPILVSTPAGVIRIIPRLVYVRWGIGPLVLP